MKHLFILVFSLSCLSSVAQTKIPVDSAKNYKDKLVTICAKVYGIKYLEKSEITFIDLGAAYPDAPLTVVILAKDKANFPQNPETLYSDKQICVTGTIKEYEGRLEIDVESPDQIAVQ